MQAQQGIMLIFYLVLENWIGMNPYLIALMAVKHVQSTTSCEGFRPRGTHIQSTVVSYQHC